MNIYLIVVLLSIIEGLTEFIPVSSTGHLIIFGELFNFSDQKADVFSVFIQLGAILAVVVVYKDRFLDLLKEDKGNALSGKEGILKLAVASFPALFFGLMLYSLIKSLFNPVTVALALIVGGVVLIFIEKFTHSKTGRRLEDFTYRDAFLIGCAQCFALWPGMSRSGSTIVGGMLLGFEKKLAAEFSFFLAVPVMICAVSFDLLKSIKYLSTSDIPMFAIGFVISFLVAIFAIKFFLRVLEKYSLKPFGIYRVILGFLVIGFFYLK